MSTQKNHPEFLTPKMRSIVEKLVERFGDGHNNVKRSELKKAAIDLFGTKAAPRWITRNMNVRIKRGRYDLGVLMGLPVREKNEKESKEG